jgi:hypothetical protein
MAKTTIKEHIINYAKNKYYFHIVLAKLLFLLKRRNFENFIEYKLYIFL